jgi:hypothetical protein
MEDRTRKESVSVEFRKKICGHWKAAGDTNEGQYYAGSGCLEDEFVHPATALRCMRK